MTIIFFSMGEVIHENREGKKQVVNLTNGVPVAGWTSVTPVHHCLGPEAMATRGSHHQEPAEELQKEEPGFGRWLLQGWASLWPPGLLGAWYVPQPGTHAVRGLDSCCLGRLRSTATLLTRRVRFSSGPRKERVLPVPPPLTSKSTCTLGSCRFTRTLWQGFTVSFEGPFSWPQNASEVQCGICIWLKFKFEYLMVLWQKMPTSWLQRLQSWGGEPDRPQDRGALLREDGRLLHESQWRHRG